MSDVHPLEQGHSAKVSKANTHRQYSGSGPVQAGAFPIQAVVIDRPVGHCRIGQRAAGRAGAEIAAAAGRGGSSGRAKGTRD